MDFLAESPPVSSSRALLLFRASGFGTSTMGQRRFATGGSTFTATSVLPPRSSSGGKHNGKHGNGRRGRRGISFIPTRETKQEGSSLIDATSTESARKKIFFRRGLTRARAVPNYFPVQGEGAA